MNLTQIYHFKPIDMNSLNPYSFHDFNDIRAGIEMFEENIKTGMKNGHPLSNHDVENCKTELLRFKKAQFIFDNNLPFIESGQLISVDIVEAFLHDTVAVYGDLQKEYESYHLHPLPKPDKEKEFDNKLLIYSLIINAVKEMLYNSCKTRFFPSRKNEKKEI